MGDGFTIAGKPRAIRFCLLVNDFGKGMRRGGLPFGSSFPVVALTPAVGYNETRSLLGPESYHELLGHS